MSQNNQTKEKVSTCKRKINGSKQVIIGKNHSWAKTYDLRYMVCSVCGAAKKV
jgi:hypothetical protein